jgi:transcriptional regulator GlxA family with amidase domain
MDPRVQKTLSIIELEYKQENLIETLSKTFNLSSSRLRHLFKLETGIPISKYIHKLRLKRSKLLLETTFLSVKEIAFDVGIRDYSHFVRDFEKEFGLSPTKYRYNYHQRKSESLQNPGLAKKANK